MAPSAIQGENSKPVTVSRTKPIRLCCLPKNAKLPPVVIQYAASALTGTVATTARICSTQRGIGKARGNWRGHCSNRLNASRAREPTIQARPTTI